MNTLTIWLRRAGEEYRLFLLGDVYLRLDSLEQKRSKVVVEASDHLEKAVFSRLQNVEDSQSEMLREMHDGINSANGRIDTLESHSDSCELVKLFDTRLKALEKEKKPAKSKKK